MGEIVTLFDDILGDGEPADERIAFAAEGKSWEIDLNAEHAAELRQVFADVLTTTRLALTIDGRDHVVNLPTDLVEKFRAELERYTSHARQAKAKTHGERRSDTPARRAPSGPVPVVGEQFWINPTNISHGSNASHEWKAFRQVLRQWGRDHGFHVAATGMIPQELGDAYAKAQRRQDYSAELARHLAKVGEPRAAAPSVAEVENALYPAPKKSVAAAKPKRKRTTP